MKINPLYVGITWLVMCFVFYLNARYVEAGISLGLSQVWILWDNISDLLYMLKIGDLVLHQQEKNTEQTPES